MTVVGVEQGHAPSKMPSLQQCLFICICVYVCMGPPELVFPSHFLKIMIELKAFGPTYVL